MVMHTRRVKIEQLTGFAFHSHFTSNIVLWYCTPEGSKTKLITEVSVFTLIIIEHGAMEKNDSSVKVELMNHFCLFIVTFQIKADQMRKLQLFLNPKR